MHQVHVQVQGDYKGSTKWYPFFFLHEFQAFLFVA